MKKIRIKRLNNNLKISKKILLQKQKNIKKNNNNNNKLDKLDKNLNKFKIKNKSTPNVIIPDINSYKTPFNNIDDLSEYKNLFYRSNSSNTLNLESKSRNSNDSDRTIMQNIK